MVEDTTCIICGNPSLFTTKTRQRRVCNLCAPKTGVVAMPPARRSPAPCTRCGHTKLVRVVPRELTVSVDPDRPYGEFGAPSYAPMFATYAIRSDRDGKLAPVDARAGFGGLEMYICKGCGFVEWYCHDPGEIPIGPEYMSEEIDVTGTSPYR